MTYNPQLKYTLVIWCTEGDYQPVVETSSDYSDELCFELLAAFNSAARESELIMTAEETKGGDIFRFAWMERDSGTEYMARIYHNEVQSAYEERASKVDWNLP